MGQDLDTFPLSKMFDAEEDENALVRDLQEVFKKLKCQF